MKNVTISLDEESYRKARVIAAQRDTSLSALVKKYLLALTAEGAALRDPKKEQEALLDRIWRRHPGFTAADNVSRDALHERS